MPEIALIKSPWEDVFLDLVEQTKEKLRITSPFIKLNPVEKMISAKDADVSIEYITSFKLMNFYRKSSDFKALYTILKNNGIIRNYQPLHSKVYIFDEKQAIITSGNLTNGGLNTNYEYGVLIKDENNVGSVMQDFYDIFNSSITGKISFEKIENAHKIIQDTPREKQVKFKPLQYEEDENDVFDIGLFPIVENLTGWKLEVFNCLDSIKNRTFSLEEAYAFEDILSDKYPNNHNIKDKIRQQLQYLRDLGLIEFEVRGVYKKTMEIMKSYIFLTFEGHTYQPYSESIEPDIENLQVIGISKGNTSRMAFENLIKENNHLLETTFNEIISYELNSNFNSSVDYFSLKEKLKHT